MNLFPKSGAIYSPPGQAGEYAELAANPYKGCGHGCAYCYVPLMTKQPRPLFDAGATNRLFFLKQLQDRAIRAEQAGFRGQVMLTFTSDPYHPGDTSSTRYALQILRQHGLGFCTLTKGGLRALADIDLFRPDRDAFACTLTSLSDTFSKKWERNAALPAERLSALRAFHSRGIFTWVSLEPTLDVDASLAIVEATAPFVDLYKVGRANYVKELTRITDWAGYTWRMIALLRRLGKAHYIKNDLQAYLPPGYVNPVHVRQYHAA